MKKQSSFLFLLLILLVSCSNSKKSQEVAGLPSCLQKQLDDYDKNAVSNKPIQIDEYTYKGKRTFLVTADCCDQYNNLIDEECNQLCAPSGGLDGGGDRKCTDFDSTAKLVKKIWPK
jgi:hypothetical protein